MWICKNCNEEVPDNFQQCWNCQSEKGKINPIVEPDVINDDYFRIDLSNNKILDLKQITSAGKQLKHIVIFILIYFAILLISGIFLLFSEDRKVYLFMIIAGILLQIIVLSKLFYAGSALEKIIKEKKDNIK